MLRQDCKGLSWLDSALDFTTWAVWPVHLGVQGAEATPAVMVGDAYDLLQGRRWVQHAWQQDLWLPVGTSTCGWLDSALDFSI